MQNFYKIMPKDLKPKVRNPNYVKHQIDLPARILIVGCSGSMKTNFALGLLQLMGPTFDHLCVCTANADEPLYNYLRSKIDSDQIEFHEGIEDVPPPEEIQGEQKLVIFDDLMLAKNQSVIETHFIRGRKQGETGIYIAQNYHQIPMNIRKNADIIILKRINQLQDLDRILSQYGLDCSKHELRRMYTYATESPEDALVIDTHKRTFRKNFSTDLRA